MDLKKLNETIERALSETFSLEEVAKGVLKRYVEKKYVDLTNNEVVSEHAEEIEEELAEAAGWKLYGDGNKNYLVLDVKFRPTITNSEVADYLATDEGGTACDTEIDLLGRELEQDYDDFATVGRSGGYWGFGDVEIEVSPNGLEVAGEAFVEFMKNLLDEEDTNPLYKEDEKHFDDLCQQILSTDYKVDEAIAEKLVEDVDNFQFTKELTDKMNDLSNRIDEKEKEMNTKEFWGI